MLNPNLGGLFNNLKTKNKLIGSFLFLIFIFAVVSVIFHHANTSTKKGYELTLNTAVEAVLHMDRAILNAYHGLYKNEQFNSTGNKNNLYDASESMKALMTEMNGVKELARLGGRDDMLPVFESFDSLFSSYELKSSELINKVGAADPGENRNLLIRDTRDSINQVIGLIEEIQAEARKDMERFVEATHKKSNKISMTAAIIGFISAAAGLLFSLIISNSISKPIIRAVEFAEEISEGNFTSTLESGRKDEMGQLSQALNIMKTKLSLMINELMSTSKNLSESSTELSAISSQIASSSENASKSADNVSCSSSEMSSSLNSVAAAMEQSNMNTEMVASAAEQMSATINEIAENTEKGRSISENAVKQSKNAGEKMNELGVVAQAIGKVTETINEISEQTNLLALNATIEAARAGEAGKGFAVVANEIKELAKQTADATYEIKTQIEGMQSTASSTISEIDQISGIIIDINDIVSTIATAVEEQSVSTREIAANISQVSQGIQEVNESISMSSRMAEKITEEISDVSAQAGEVSNGSSQINFSAEELSGLSEKLDAMVHQFRI